MERMRVELSIPPSPEYKLNPDKRGRVDSDRLDTYALDNITEHDYDKSDDREWKIPQFIKFVEALINDAKSNGYVYFTYYFNPGVRYIYVSKDFKEWYHAFDVGWKINDLPWVKVNGSTYYFY